MFSEKSRELAAEIGCETGVANRMLIESGQSMERAASRYFELKQRKEATPKKKPAPKKKESSKTSSIGSKESSLGLGSKSKKGVPIIVTTRSRAAPKSLFSGLEENSSSGYGEYNNIDGSRRGKRIKQDIDYNEGNSDDDDDDDDYTAQPSSSKSRMKYQHDQNEINQSSPPKPLFYGRPIVSFQSPRQVSSSSSDLTPFSPQSPSAIHLPHVDFLPHSEPEKFIPWLTATAEPEANLNPTSFSLLARALDQIESSNKITSKSTVMINLLRVAMFRFPLVVYSICALSSTHLEELSVPFSSSKAMEALCGALGIKKGQLQEMVDQDKDLGSIAMKVRGTQTLLVKPKPLSSIEVVEQLTRLGTTAGKLSDENKHETLVGLLRRCSGSEIKWLIRMMAKDLRHGLSHAAIMNCLVVAAVMHHNERESLIAKESKVFSYTKDSLQVAKHAMKNVLALNPTCTKKIVDCLLEGGVELMVQSCGLEMGRFCHPTSAMRDSCTVMEALEKIGGWTEEKGLSRPVLLEYFMDSIRCQVHLDSNGKIWIFSRNGHDVSAKFDSVIDHIRNSYLCMRELRRSYNSDSESTLHGAKTSTASSCGLFSPVDAFIIDCDLVAVERDTDGVFKHLPSKSITAMTSTSSFSPLSISSKAAMSNSSNTQNDNCSSQKQPSAVKICTLLADVLAMQGSSVMNKPLIERKMLLEGMFQSILGEVEMAPSLRLEIPTTVAMSRFKSPVSNAASDTDESAVELTDAFLTQAMKSGAKGILLKSLSDDSFYVPSRGAVKNPHWLKLRGDFVIGRGKSFSVVPIGAWHGRGKKSQWWSPILLGVSDSSSDTIQSLCLCASGISDGKYLEISDLYCNGNLLDSKPDNVSTNETPDVWFKQLEVWEIEGVNLSLSTKHSAGHNLINQNGKGITLRYPRYVQERSHRTLTTASQVVDIYTAHMAIAMRGTARGDEEDDDGGI